LASRASAAAHYTCVGIGVGPANLSLASLMYGHPALPNLFLESRDAFGWHDGQQIPGASLQVSMLKDLVSLSDPTNAFSFLNYLHEQGRTYHYLNARFDAVPRLEFRNYLAWAAERNPNIEYGQSVTAVEFDSVFRVHTEDRTVTADHIVVGVGTSPWVPREVQPHLGATQFHIADFLGKARAVGGLRVVIVGGGQSGAEAFLDLISRPAGQLPRRVTWISRRPNYLPIDDSPFTNDYYMPGHSDHFASLDAATRREFNTRHILTSDGISESTLRAIYQRAYTHRFLDGAPDLIALYPNRDVTAVAAAPTGPWQLTLTHNHHPHTPELLEADVVVWATGFRPAPTAFLAPLEHRLEREDEEYKIDQHYAAAWDGPPDHHVFIQNNTRNQRGLADPNLSLIAFRAQRILDRIRGTRTRHPHDSFIEWTPKPPADRLATVPAAHDDRLPGRETDAR
jgi:lysine N6-hydroxylase